MEHCNGLSPLWLLLCVIKLLDGLNVFSEWLWADYVLYDHFKEKFAKEIETFGRHRLEHEKEILKRAIDYKKETCIEAEVDNSLLPKEDRLFGANVMGYKLKKNTGRSL